MLTQPGSHTETSPRRSPRSPRSPRRARSRPDPQTPDVPSTHRWTPPGWRASSTRRSGSPRQTFPSRQQKVSRTVPRSWVVANPDDCHLSPAPRHRPRPDAIATVSRPNLAICKATPCLRVTARDYAEQALCRSYGQGGREEVNYVTYVEREEPAVTRIRTAAASVQACAGGSHQL